MQAENDAFIHQQANDWVVKLETGAMSEADEDRFVVWLEQDERHGQALHQAEQSWQLMQQALQLDEQSLAQSVNHPDNRELDDGKRLQTSKVFKNSSWWQKLMPLAATLLLTLSGFVWWQDAYFAVFADHYTSTGKRSQVELSDGSVLTLNTDSAVDILFDDQQRLVKVLSGEVHAMVAKEGNGREQIQLMQSKSEQSSSQSSQPQASRSEPSTRPFVVIAGEMRVTALGTEFIVRHDNQTEPTVTVTEHSVRVESLESVVAQTVLQAGEKVSLLQDRDKLTVVEQVDSRYAQAWRQGKYVFEDQPFTQVIKELNRYYTGKIVINDKKVAAMRVSGVLNLDQPIVSLEQLAQPLSVRIQQVTPLLILLSAS